MIQTADNTQPQRLSITVRDVMTFTGKSKAAANRLLSQLEADGLRRKGVGRGTQYDRRQFLDLWAKLDTRP